MELELKLNLGKIADVDQFAMKTRGDGGDVSRRDAHLRRGGARE